MRRLGSAQRGFTIIELMIATAAFSLVLLLCTFAVLNIGRSYYKGVIVTRTQEAARAVTEDIADSIRFGGAEVTRLRNVDGSKVEAFCIGEAQFSYQLGVQLAEPTDTALRKHRPCFGEASEDALKKSGTELLRLRMRLDRLVVEPIPGSAGVYRVVVRVVHGEDDLLEKDIDGNLVCKQQRTGSEYCAVSELSTIVERRI